jgi:hypothetical protein
MSLLDHLDPLERLLASRGWVPMSDWWRDQFTRFYASGCREFVLRVGRRGGKSSSISRIAVLEALFGTHEIPRGDTGVVAIVSVKLAEARDRLKLIKALLDEIGSKYTTIDQYGILLVDKPVAFRVFAAGIGSVSGFTAIVVFCDEVSKWKDEITGKNPATEVLAAVRPTMVSMKSAKMFLCSSPLGNDDGHAKAFEKGNTPRQLIASAPTWVANPTLTEEWTHGEEEDDLTWSREYGAIPHDGSVESIYTPPMIDRAVARRKHLDPKEPLAYDPGATYMAAMDPAMRGDSWTLCIVGTWRARASEQPRYSLVCAKEWRGKKKVPLDPDVVFADVRSALSRYGLRSVWQDQHNYDALRSSAGRAGVETLLENSTATTNVQVHENLKNLMAQGTFDMPNLPTLKADLGNVRMMIGKGGGPRVEVPHAGDRHCDFAPSLTLAVSKLVWRQRNTSTEVPRTMPGGYQGLGASRRGDPRGGALGL